jgi:hypothetical protein
MSLGDGKKGKIVPSNTKSCSTLSYHMEYHVNIIELQSLEPQFSASFWGVAIAKQKTI